MLSTPPITPPPFLYKYRPPEYWAYDSLEDGALRLTRPWEFNDPHDFLIPLSLTGLTDNDFETLRLHRPDMFENAPKDKGGFVVCYNEAFKNKHSQMRERMSVVCFSECNKIPRMWSRYSDRGRGFCLAFNPQKCSIFKDIAKMTYRQGTPSASEVVDMLLAKANTQIPYMGVLAYKSKKWEYEREWRILEHPMFCLSRDTYYKPEALVAVYFGIKATQETKQYIRDVLESDDGYRHVKMWEGTPCDGEHKIRFTPYP